MHNPLLPLQIKIFAEAEAGGWLFNALTNNAFRQFQELSASTRGGGLLLKPENRVDVEAGSI